MDEPGREDEHDAPAWRRARIPWIDAARGYGMILVFYGHVLNPLIKQGEPHALLQFKLIYAFHMPLFFVLAGYVSKTPGRPLPYLQERLRARLVPAWFFCALALSVGVGQRLWLGLGLGLPPFTNLADFLYLVPVGNHITWFLFCLVAVELYHLALWRLEGRWQWELAIVPALFALGAVSANEGGAVLQALGLRRAPLYLGEAVTAYALFRAGRLARRMPWCVPGPSRRRAGLVGGLALLVLLASFDANRGAFSWHVPVVMMSAQSHGISVLFALSALAGSLAVMHLSFALPAPAVILFLGRSSLCLLGLNGIFVHYVNKPLIAAAGPLMSGGHWRVLAFASLFTALSLALCAPLVMALERWLPWAVGRRRAGSRRS